MLIETFPIFNTILIDHIGHLNFYALDIRKFIKEQIQDHNMKQKYNKPYSYERSRSTILKNLNLTYINY